MGILKGKTRKRCLFVVLFCFFFFFFFFFVRIRSDTFMMIIFGSNDIRAFLMEDLNFYVK
jgi:hypothetical protein